MYQCCSSGSILSEISGEVLLRRVAGRIAVSSSVSADLLRQRLSQIHSSESTFLPNSLSTSSLECDLDILFWLDDCE